MLTAEQLDTIEQGDVVRMKSGTFRTVRSASYRHAGRLLAVTFAIRRCSWTKRPYTVVNRNDLRYRATHVYKARRTPETELEWKLQREIDDPKGIRCLDCCDVIGIVN